MSKIIIKKFDDKLITAKLERKVSKKPYIEKNDISQTNIINIEKSLTLSAIEKEKAAQLIKALIEENNKMESGKKLIIECFNGLKKAKNKSDLQIINNILLLGYEKTIYSKSISYANLSKKLYNLTKKNEDLMLSLLIKKLIKTYFLNKLLRLGKEYIEVLHELKLNNKPSEELLNLIGERFDEELDSNGIKELSVKILLDTIDIVYRSLQVHLCWNICANATVKDCQKIKDISKKTIGEYPFIKAGYQIYGERKNLLEFVVTDCANFVMEQPKILTQEDRQRIKRSRDLLRMEYFEAETIEESYKVESEIAAKQNKYMKKR